MPNPPRVLDQARDPLVRVYQDAASEYDAYLQGEYNDNYKVREQHWQEHYYNMRTVLHKGLRRTLEEGVPLKEINLAIVGPGLDPIGRDIDDCLVEVWLKKLKSIVVVDFSTHVVRSAMDALVEAGIDSQKVLGMQYDITDGASTGYNRYIKNKLDPVDTEDKLLSVSEEMAKATMDDIDASLMEVERDVDIASKVPDLLLPGGFNSEDRPLTLSVKGEPLPIHLWAAPMVFAGTGAASEDRIWEMYNSVTSDVHRGAHQPGPKTDSGRLRIHENCFKMIARYNTLMAILFLHKAIRHNPGSRFVAVSDVTTNLQEFGTMPRLYTESLRDELRNLGLSIRFDDTCKWQWDDEPEHSHDILSFEVRKA